MVDAAKDTLTPGDTKDNWIPKDLKKGQLHRDLGLPQGKKIPLALEKKAAKRKGKVGERAKLSLKFRKMNKGK